MTSQRRLTGYKMAEKEEVPTWRSNWTAKRHIYTECEGNEVESSTASSYESKRRLIDFNGSDYVKERVIIDQVYESNSWWSKKMGPMKFVFDTNCPDNQCVSEENEDKISRFLNKINEYMRRGDFNGAYSKLHPVEPGTQEYRRRIRRMAIIHIQDCLEQGIKNEKFKKQQQQRDQGKSFSITSPSTYRDQVIDEKEVKWIVEVTTPGQGFSSHPIDPKDAPFLHPAIACLKPTCPSEPFMLLGIAVKCCELEDIFDSENLKRKGRRQKYKKVTFNGKVSIDSTAQEIISFLKKIYEDCHKVQDDNYKGQFMDGFIHSLTEFMQQNMEIWLEKWRYFIEQNRTAKSLFHHLSTWINEKPDFGEKHLQYFAYLLLDLDGCPSIHVNTKKLKLFEKNPSPMSNIVKTCTPGLSYVPEPAVTTKFAIITEVKKRFITELAMKMANSLIKSKIVSVEVQSDLGCQIYEQLLANVMDSGTQKDRLVYYQGGLLVFDSKVRSVILAIPSDVYKKLKEVESVIDTLNFILDYEQDWCTLYFEKSDHPIWEINERSKITYYNFAEN